MQEKKLGTFRDGQGMELSPGFHHEGEWKIETKKTGKTVRGKAIMTIEIRDSKTNQVLDCSPSHDAICNGILEAILRVEFDNDTFTFENGVMGPHRRTQIFNKIRQVQAKLNEWKQHAISAGLIDKDANIIQTILVPKTEKEVA